MIQNCGGKKCGEVGKFKEICQNFLVQNFPSYKSKIAKFSLETEQHIVILKIDSKLYRLDSSWLVSLCNTRKIA